MSHIADINNWVQRGRYQKVVELIDAALAEGETAKSILEDGLLAAMSEVGEQFRQNKVFVTNVLLSARAMNMGIEHLKPHLVAGDVAERGVAVIGTVRGDMHDIGKNLVKMMLEGKGIRVIDLGVDTAPEAFVAAACENNANIICCSALLTTTMGEMGEVVKAVRAEPKLANCKIMIGGAPVNAEFCATIGADFYTTDAATAADVAVEICG